MNKETFSIKGIIFKLVDFRYIGVYLIWGIKTRIK